MNAWLEAIKAFLAAITGVSKAVEVRTKPAEILVEEHNEGKELREQDNFQEKLNDDFGYLKRRVEIDVWDYIREEHPKMPMEDLVLYHKILQARVYQYRYDNAKNPFVPKKIRDWVKKNPRKQNQ